MTASFTTAGVSHCVRTSAAQRNPFATAFTTRQPPAPILRGAGDPVVLEEAGEEGPENRLGGLGLPDVQYAEAGLLDPPAGHAHADPRLRIAARQRVRATGMATATRASEVSTAAMGRRKKIARPVSEMMSDWRSARSARGPSTRARVRAAGEESSFFITYPPTPKNTH